MTQTHLHNGDCLDVLATLPEKSVHCCVTSPPYFGLRDYGHESQIGLEETPEAYVAKLVAVFREVRRVLRDDGTLWLNLGDSYAGGKTGRDDADRGTRHTDGRNPLTQGEWKTPQGKSRPVPHGLKPKDLIGIPWMVAFALRADGWWLRQEIIWNKPNPMPESVTDRCTKAHEDVFLLSKSARYYFDNEAISEPAVGVDSRTAGNGKRNRRSVWTVATSPYKGAHFATYPPKLIEPCILAGCPVGGVVLDPFMGSGTTLAVAVQHGRNGIGIELNPEYLELAKKRIADATPRQQSICYLAPESVHEHTAAQQALF